jgi:hypothetical protein
MNFYDRSMWVMTFLVLGMTGYKFVTSWCRKRERKQRMEKLHGLLERG